jgi:SAM-dependent methyltransferase
VSGQPSTCWCGGDLGKEIGRHYRECTGCGAAVLTRLPGPEHFDVSDDVRDFYGKRYWTDYPRSRNLPDILERVRSDLSERCLFWLERLLEVARPPGRALEIGCGHGGFVRFMRELGFDAVGTELSGWVVEFAKRTFDVPVLHGRLETLDLEPGFTCIAAFDVLEHLSDPLGTARRCVDLLALDGVLLLQTPWYRGEGPDWSMLQEDEHIHLFTEASIRLLLERAGFREALVRPSLFSYDMLVVASRGRLHVGSIDRIEVNADWRLPVAFRSLLDLSRYVSRVREDLATAEVDRAARLAQVVELTGQVHGLEAARVQEADARRDDTDKLTELLREADEDRAARLAQIVELTGQVRGLEAARQQEAEARREDVDKLTDLLREAEADGAARLAQIEELTEQVRGLEAVRLQEAEARREDIDKLTELLREADADRAARLAQIEELTAQMQRLEAARLQDSQHWREDVSKMTQLLREAEADGAARLRQVEEVSRLLRDSDADRAARLGQVEELTRLLRESDADRAARLEEIHELSRLLEESKAARETGLEVIRNLHTRVADMERTWAWRLYTTLPLTGRKAAE